MEIEAGGRTFIVKVDNEPEIATDPIVLVFEQGYDEPLAVVHVNVGNGPHCGERNHVTVNEGWEDEA